jgi:hypothetical protein
MLLLLKGCCGIENYLDYNNVTKFGSEKQHTRSVSRHITPEDPAWHLIEQSESRNSDKNLFQDTSHSKLRTEIKFVFNVTRSCCKYAKRVTDKDCNAFVEYGHDKGSNQVAGLTMINNHTLVNMKCIIVGSFDF